MYDSSAATARSQCRMNSHDAAERHAAHRGDRRHEAVAQAHATSAGTARPPPRPRPSVRASIAGASAARFAPNENGSRVCQMTSPAKPRFGGVERAHACRRARRRRSCSACVLNETMPTSPLEVPHAQRRRSRTSSCRDRTRSPSTASGKRWRAVDRQRRTRHERVRRGRIRARRARARRPAAAHLVAAHPAGSGTRASALPAAMSSSIQCGDLAPARRLPRLERPHLPAEAPADREVDVARVVGDRPRAGTPRSGRGRGRSPTGVAPADAPTRAASRSARPAILDREERGHLRRDRARAWRGSRPSRDRAPGCPCRPCGRSRPSSSARARPWRPAPRAPAASANSACHGSSGSVSRIVADHVRERVEADDVGGAVGGALRAADRRPGQRVDDVEAAAQRSRVCTIVASDREDADAVGDEVRRVLRADHALAERRWSGTSPAHRGAPASVAGAAISSTRCM